VSLIIRIYTDETKFAAFMAVPFIIFCHIHLVLFFYHCMYGLMFCMLLFNLVKCAFFGERNFNIIKMHGKTIKIVNNVIRNLKSEIELRYKLKLISCGTENTVSDNKSSQSR
jgi:hypothetical protein